MEVNLMDINRLYDKIKIPSNPHITDIQEPVTEEELQDRMRIAEELEKLGISISKFDTADGHEDKDEMQAIILVKQGKNIPEDLKERLMDKKRMADKKSKQDR